MFLMNLLEDLELFHLLEVENDFTVFENSDFYVAHTQDYVESFFKGKQPICESNSIPWSKDFANTVRYTNGSLYSAIRQSLEKPEQITLSPTSGFHHASPNTGAGFCTFSGQVIAAVKLFREKGVRGAFLDLDGHFGNSIEDTRDFVSDLIEAVPYGMNINPTYSGSRYVDNLKQHLSRLREAVLNDYIHYVVWCHGADSHSDDDLGSGQCNTQYWVECSRVFFQWVKDLDAERGKPLSVTISLFGGYRSDDFKSVLELHVADITECAATLLNVGTAHVPVLHDRWGYETYYPGV